MERIKVNLPSNYPFSTTIKIRITDLNYGGHVGNDSFLSLVHEAREQFFNHYGYSELKLGGVGVIMADVAIEYKKELNFGNEVRISVAANGFDRLGFDLFYLLEVWDDNSWKVAGKVKTGMMCYNYDEKKKMPVPKEVIERLTSGH